MKLPNQILNHFFFFLLFYVNGFSQTNTNDPINLKTPTSLDFIKYGNIGASMNEGTIDMKIPLVSIPVKDQNNINIDLVYNSSGFIPSKRSGPVGLNWHINLGGLISREVKGVPDDTDGDPATNANNYYDPNGFIVGVRKKNFNASDVFNFNATTGYLHLSQKWLLGSVDNSNVDNAYEGTPDIFSFNFNGISGKFFMGNDGEVKVVTNQPNKLVVDLSGFNIQTAQTRSRCNPVALSEIKITDNDGNTYIFGGKPENLEYSIFLGTTGPNSLLSYRSNKLKAIITSWYLTKIIYSNNKTINFSYRKNDSIIEGGNCECATPGNTNPLFNLIGYINESSTSIRKKNLDLIHQHFVNSTSYSFSAPKVSWEINKQAILDKVEGEDFYLNFSYSSQSNYFNKVSGVLLDYENLDLKLDSIKLFNKNDKPIKTLKFGYEYKGGSNSRLFLKNLEESGKVPYVFYYKQDYDFPVPTTKGIDYWGFWNGNDNSTKLIPGIQYEENGDYSYTTSIREPNFDYAKQGLLEKVVYPTGGWTIFEYEPHDYSLRLECLSSNTFLPSLNMVNGKVGGARIFKITDFNNGISENTKEYKYLSSFNPNNQSNSVSSGILLKWPRYATVLEAKNDLQEYIRVANYNSTSINNSIMENSNVKYSEVVEKTSNNGYTVYKFSDFVSNPDRNDVNYRYNVNLATMKPEGLSKLVNGDVFNDLSIQRGLIKYKKIYDSNFNIISEEIYNYNESLSKYNSFSVSINDNIYHAKANKLYFYNEYLTSKTVNSFYDGQKFLMNSIENFVYDPLTNNLKTYNSKNSAKQKIEKRNFYAEDLLTEPFMIDLKNINKIGKPIITEQYTDDVLVSKSKTSYAKDATTNNLVLPKAEYSAKFPNALPSILYIGNLEKKVTYDKYDDKGNVQQYTPESGVPVSIIWGYNKTLPVAKILNLAYSLIPSALITAVENATLSTATQASLLTALVNLRNDQALSNAMVTTYTHIPLVGVSTITDPKGLKTTYEYDAFNRLKWIKDQNDNILQKYCYNYKGQQVNCEEVVYKNVAKSGTFTRNNCGAGFTGSSVTYNVAAGVHSSTISQVDADNKAQADVNANGQNYANVNGSCTAVSVTDFTFDWDVDYVSEKVIVNLIASNSSHNGAQYTFKISYLDEASGRGVMRTTTRTVTLPAGSTTFSVEYPLITSDVYNVELTKLLRL